MPFCMGLAGLAWTRPTQYDRCESRINITAPKSKKSNQQAGLLCIHEGFNAGVGSMLRGKARRLLYPSSNDRASGSPS